MIMYNEQQLAELKTRKINRIINIVLLVLVILVSGVYIYIVLPSFFDDPMPPIPPREVAAPLTSEEKQTILESVIDPIENDETGMMNVLKSIPKNPNVNKLSDKEKSQILEGK